MTREVLTASPDMNLDALVGMLLERGYSRVPVVDDDGRLVGMVATTDVVTDEHLRGDTREAEPSVTAAPAPAREPTFAGFHVHTAGTSVSDVMTRRVVSLPETASIAEAAMLMATQHLHGVPVTTAAGRIVGIVSTSDIVAWVAGM